MTQSTAVPPWLNPAMKSILRSPIHGMVSKSTLLITLSACADSPHPALHRPQRLE